MLAERYRLHTRRLNEVRVGYVAADHHKEGRIGFPDIDCIHQISTLERTSRRGNTLKLVFSSAKELSVQIKLVCTKMFHVTASRARLR